MVTTAVCAGSGWQVNPVHHVNTWVVESWRIECERCWIPGSSPGPPPHRHTQGFAIQAAGGGVRERRYATNGACSPTRWGRRGWCRVASKGGGRGAQQTRPPRLGRTLHQTPDDPSRSRNLPPAAHRPDTPRQTPDDSPYPDPVARRQRPATRTQAHNTGICAMIR
jgi:hypothetical protein